MDKLLLKLVLWFVKHSIKKDVDIEKLQIICETKLIMDRRRARVSMKQASQKEPKNQLLVTQIIYALVGLLIGGAIFSIKDIVAGMALLHSYMLFMMAMTLITDFSSVLLDTTDNQVILPRPVNSRTFFMSRLVHILVYLLQFTIAIALFPIISCFIKYGFAVGIASIFTILLTVLMAVFLTYLLYGLILKFANESKIKDIVSGFQIAITIVFAAGMQIAPRFINFSDLNVTFNIKWYSYFLPPMWMANLLEAIYTFQFDVPHIAMILLAITIPVGTFWIMFKYLAPSFSKKMAALGNSSGEGKPTLVTSNSMQRTSFAQQIAPLVCKNNTEKAGFEIGWIMTARDKMFKMQFYPSIAYLLVMVFIFIFKSGSNIQHVWANLSNTKMFLLFAYLPIITISTGIGLLPYNEYFKASWIYLATPLQQPGSLISGAVKSILVKFFIPIFIILFGFSFYVWGVAIIDDMLLGLVNNILIFFLIIHIGKSYLPFSTQVSTQQQTGKFVKMLLQLLFISLPVGLHYIATIYVWLLWAMIPASLLISLLIIKTIQQYRWQKIAS
ncbi:hypothetical protein ACFOWM_02650 [Ferruginibacter yonginensis]|uniref:ABC-2 type transport system permease protein n=1 Tax=Ferruginibacter yonginensis TaxID=1310416 RepID=A0ABV8QN87_9BACT